jgi:hypothetical protein
MCHVALLHRSTAVKATAPPRSASSSLQLPSLALRMHHALRVATTSHTLSSSPTRRRRTDKIPTPRVPFTASLPLCLCVTRADTHPTTLPPRRAVPFPTHACHHPCCPIYPPIARVYKAPSPLHIIHSPPSVGPQVSRHHPPVPPTQRPSWRFLLITSPSFPAGPRAPQGPRAAPRPAQVTSSSSVSPSIRAAPVSFRFLIARPPSYELVLLAMSGGFNVRLGCSR